jgi:hypothetical protein
MTTTSVDPTLAPALHAFAAALHAGRPMRELLKLWEHVSRLLPPAAGEAEPPAGVPVGPELAKRLRRYRRAVHLFAALTAPAALRKRELAATRADAGAVLRFSMLDLRSLTTARTISDRRTVAAQAAPADPLRVAADAAASWPPPASDAALRRQAQAAGVRPAALAALLDLAAAELPDALAPELLAAGLLELDPADPGLMRRSPAGWAALERAILSVPTAAPL